MNEASPGAVSSFRRALPSVAASYKSPPTANTNVPGIWQSINEGCWVVPSDTALLVVYASRSTLAAGALQQSLFWHLHLKNAPPSRSVITLK